MGYPAATEQSKRWLVLYNATGEEIPPFGCCMLNGYAPDMPANLGTIMASGEPVWPVTVPSLYLQETQNSAVCFFNGKKSIPPGKTGVGTRDFPVLALHNGAIDGLRPGVACGPVAGEFFLLSGGRAFRCMGHDDADPDEREGEFGGIHTMWIDNGPELSGILGRFEVAGETPIDLGENVIFGDDPRQAVAELTSVAFTIDEEAGYIYVNEGRAGVFLASFSCCLWSDDTDIAQGVDLKLQFTNEYFDFESGDYVALEGFVLTRRHSMIWEIENLTHDHDLDTSTSPILHISVWEPSVEMVSFTIPVGLASFSRLSFKNTTGYKIRVTGGVLSLTQVTGPTQQQSTPESV